MCNYDKLMPQDQKNRRKQDPLMGVFAIGVLLLCTIALLVMIFLERAYQWLK